MSTYDVVGVVLTLHYLNLIVYIRYCYFSHFTDDEIDHRPVNNENTGVSLDAVNVSLNLDAVNASLNHDTQRYTFTIYIYAI